VAIVSGWAVGDVADRSPELVAVMAPGGGYGGSADEYWDGRLARSLTPHGAEVEGADHGMFVPPR
jgi:hypothetical protein